MSIFSSILNKIFPTDHPTSPGASQAGISAAPRAQGENVAAASTTSIAASTPSPVDEPLGEIDVEAVLTQMQAAYVEQLNWRTSIVDLLKLLGLNSSFSARKELAAELHYSGNTADCAAMNMWLHKQVMQKLSENGGKVPESLKS
jgi:hypothetical protein